MIGNIASEWLNKQAGIMTRSFKQTDRLCTRTTILNIQVLLEMTFNPSIGRSPKVRQTVLMAVKNEAYERHFSSKGALHLCFDTCH